MKKTLTIAEISEIIGCCVRTLERMIADGRFPVKPIPGTKPKRWATEAVEAWRLSGGNRA